VTQYLMAGGHVESFSKSTDPEFLKMIAE